MDRTANLDAAKQATLAPIGAIAEKLGLPSEFVEPYGKFKAKVNLAAIDASKRAPGRVVLVSAINPTSAGEGKTTTSIGLSQGLARIGRNVAVALREPSLGPVFGVKGGGCGGGKSQVGPMVDINLHFTGDLHAITAAHNLLAAAIDNALHHGTAGELDPRGVTWRRSLDMNERALRDVVIGLGGRNGGVPRETGFDITAASEVMAIMALATDLDDLQKRLGRIVVGRTRKGGMVTAADIGFVGSMTVLLKDALHPNLVQTLEGVPAIVHCGPFGNIAHGCNSIVGTRLARAYADIVVTEAGFGFDLGAEKFLDIKCPTAGMWPSAVVIVATLRALKRHGGVPDKDIDAPHLNELRAGFANLARHIATARAYGFEPVVAINRHLEDTAEETELVVQLCHEIGITAVPANPFGGGGEGCEALAHAVAARVDAAPADPQPKPLYAADSSAIVKMNAIAKTVYGADGVDLAGTAAADLARYAKWGIDTLPICMAKTQMSLSDQADRPGAPTGFRITVREVRASAGAGFLVALTGDVMTMPGLPKEPAGRNIGLDEHGEVVGLF